MRVSITSSINNLFMIRILTLSALVATLSSAVLLADERPNFVLIISDDHRADWMGHKGHPHMETPHLDRLAAEGISFPNAFATSGVCSPSRASILTGRYAHRASAPEIVWCNASFLENQVTVAEHLQAVGYRTGYIGKFHLGREEELMRGFDFWASYPFVGDFHDQTTRPGPRTAPW